MKRAILAMMLAATAVQAEEAGWRFEKGAVYEYDCETTVDLKGVPGGAAAGTADRKERHLEQVRVRFEVTSVDATGTAELSGSFPRVHVENTTVVGKAEYDSDTDVKSRFLGFKRYEGLRAVTFTAKVAKSGLVLEAKGAGMPDRADSPGEAKEHIEAAAFAVHDPTTPRAWLDLIFQSVPPARKDERRTVRVIEEETVSVTFARNEARDGKPCAKSVFETPDRPHSTDPRVVGAYEGSDAAAMTWAALRQCYKKGEVWFSTRDRALHRMEMEAETTLGWNSNVLNARMTWTVTAVVSRGAR